MLISEIWTRCTDVGVTQDPADDAERHQHHERHHVVGRTHGDPAKTQQGERQTDDNGDVNVRRVVMRPRGTPVPLASAVIGTI